MPDMSLETWLLYLLAAVGLSVSPGPNSLLALTHGALHGWRAALATIAGGSVGFVTLIALSLFGIGALLQAWPVGLTALKWVGGAYLAGLGIQVWRSPPIRLDLGMAPDAVSAWALWRQGALAALTNPKGLLFFAAFLPQFIDPRRDLVTQFVLMAGTFAAVEFATEWALAITAHRFSGWLGRAGRTFNRACGALFLCIGVLLPLRA
jgi:homoserine/homoserine lactone efflux protein